jgi:hypothetical protein
VGWLLGSSSVACLSGGQHLAILGPVLQQAFANHGWPGNHSQSLSGINIHQVLARWPWEGVGTLILVSLVGTPL